MNLLLTDVEEAIIHGDLVSDVLQGTLNPLDPIVWGGMVPGSVHDLYLQDGQLSVTGGLAQRIDCRLRTIQGEDWLAPSNGVPWFTEIFKKSPDLTTVRQILVTVIQAVPGVTQVDSLVLDFDRRNRILSVIFSARGQHESASGSTVVQL